jgi:tetratricopeptide (TPR) repeat protein
MVEHDRKVAIEAFEAALALSASCAFAYSFGCAPVAFGGDAERAIDWGRRAIRLSPLDSANYIPHSVIGFAYFLLGRHEEAAVACRRAIQENPGFSLLHGWLAAPLAKLGRIEETKAASARLLALNPGCHHKGRGLRPARIVQVRRDRTTDEQVAELLDGFCGLGFQDRVRVVAKEHTPRRPATRIPRDYGAIGLADGVDDGTGT